MEKLATFLIFLSLLSSMAGSYHAEPQLPNADESRICGLCHGKERVTKLRFYVQDLVGGDNRTVWKVADTNLSYILPSYFGIVAVLDNLVTSGPEIDSEEVGRLQGMIGLSDFREKALVMLLNLVFTRGEYKGSTLSILGRNPLEDKVREVPVVGGTGAFRMARGYVVTSTYSASKAQTYAVYKYDVVVFHMDDVMFGEI